MASSDRRRTASCDSLVTRLATSSSGRNRGKSASALFPPLGDVPLFEKILCINGLGDILAVESGYEGLQAGRLNGESSSSALMSMICFIELCGNPHGTPTGAGPARRTSCQTPVLSIYYVTGGTQDWPPKPVIRLPSAPSQAPI